MAIAAERLTYEQYMAEPEEMRRYDIIDGVKEYMPNPTIFHQKLLMRISRLLEDFEEATGAGVTIDSPCDVLIRREPLRTRQPDVLLVSHQRLGNRSLTDPSPISPAPELVVEILSPSNRGIELDRKLRDFAAVDVEECWIVDPDARTVEVLSRSGRDFERVALCTQDDVAESRVFVGLKVPVVQLFRGRWAETRE